MKKIETILQYIERHDIRKAKFERDNNLGNGYLETTVKRGADISQKQLDKIKKNQKLFLDIFGNQDEQPSSKAPNKDGEQEGYQAKYIEQLLENKKLLEQQLKMKDDHIGKMQEDLMKIANSGKWEAYLQSVLALANTQLDVLLAHRSTTEKVDLQSLKSDADKIYDEYRLVGLGNGS